MILRRRLPHLFPALLLSASIVSGPIARAGAQAPTALAPAAARPRSDAQVSREADRIARAYAELERFSGSVLVARGGRVLLRRGYGLADRERGARNTPETRFDLGSLAKQFTAAAILKLESEGKLSVSDPLSKHLPDYPRPAGDQVTLHHLLTHTSGIPSLGRRGPLERVEEDCSPQTMERLIAYSKDLPLASAPGERYAYSNTGYILLAAVVERASGMAFYDYLREALFRPAGMTRTGKLDPGEAADGRAMGYDGYAPEVKPAKCVHPSWMPGAGAVHSTVDDLFRWQQALDAGEILPPAQLEKFYHPHVSRGRPGAHYAYGWFRGTMHERPLVFHGGTTAGFVSEMYRWPDDGVLVIALSNRLPELGVDVPAEITRRVGALLLGAAYDLPPRPAALRPDALRRLAGRYEFAPGFVVDVRLDGDRLMATAAGDASWSLSTVGAQTRLNLDSDTVRAGMRILRAFAEADVPALREALKPERRPQVRDSSLMFLKLLQEHDPRFGRLLTLTPYRVVPDRTGPAVDARATFERSEWFVRAELSPELQLSGWYYGGTLPSRVALTPEAGGGFFVDGFRWEEPDLRLRFTMENGAAAALVVVGADGPVTARRLPDA